ncbi:dTDP-4-dehydrorhamnose 3,5-epimerase [Aliivibrio fischeri]|uniref:dTDP-4-dehydrorhamnose 3,5-epimerase n=1 Tax=Aliivibrio fischeri TaxID=668 RepID=UPI0012DA5EF7|nr:dTDP-4-dehydrorhamnose 3,5-epimerase [Aliivibrio fischeri]MUJ37283.1 dTDP-4-dehydrorhamnose 3,5-epimerase [Aliivibrio fischeri]
MKVIETYIEGLLIIEPSVFGDERGFFMESWNQNKFNLAIDKEIYFVQDNHSKSTKGVLRGLHFQSKQMQSKLVRVTQGAVLDVAVDLRPKSITFGKYFSVELSAKNKRQLWIPKGFAHGFLTLEDNTEFLYKCDDYYNPKYEHTLNWNDEVVGVSWPKSESDFLISKKDQKGLNLDSCLQLLINT